MFQVWKKVRKNYVKLEDHGVTEMIGLPVLNACQHKTVINLRKALK